MTRNIKTDYSRRAALAVAPAQPRTHPTTGEPMGTDAQEATAWKLAAENLQRENAALRKALTDAATSLETIGRLAGKTHYLGDDGHRAETYMAHHDEVRGYANSRASVAREALAGTAPAREASRAE